MKDSKSFIVSKKQYKWYLILTIKKPNENNK